MKPATFGVLLCSLTLSLGYYRPKPYIPRFVLQRVKNRSDQSYAEQTSYYVSEPLAQPTSETFVFEPMESEPSGFPSEVTAYKINSKLDMPSGYNSGFEVQVSSFDHDVGSSQDSNGSADQVKLPQVFSSGPGIKAKKRKTKPPQRHTKNNLQIDGPKVIFGITRKRTNQTDPELGSLLKDPALETISSAVVHPISKFSKPPKRKVIRSKRDLNETEVILTNQTKVDADRNLVLIAPIGAGNSTEANNTSSGKSHPDQASGNDPVQTLEKIEFDDDEYYLDYGDFGYDDDFDDFKVRVSFNKSKSGVSKNSTNSLKQTSFSEDDDYDDEPGMLDYVTNFFAAVGTGIGTILQYAKVPRYSQKTSYDSSEEEEEETSSDLRKPKYPHYIHYDDSSEQDSFLMPNSGVIGKWLGSWFQRDKNSSAGYNDPASNKGWFSWFSNDNENKDPITESDYYDYGGWYYDWFGSKPERTSKKATSTSPIPILTIAEPMKNPQNWIGILAQHIINSTATSSTSTTAQTKIAVEDVPRVLSYNKYQVWRLKPKDASQLEALETYKVSTDGLKLQWLKGPSLKGFTDILIPPRLMTKTQSFLNSEEIDHEVLTFDLGKAIAYEKAKNNEVDILSLSNKKNYPISWQKYYRYNEIVNFMEHLQMHHSNIVKLLHIGRSYEGKPLIIVKIEKPPSQAEKVKGYKNRKKMRKNPAVFIEAGAHGREWIGPATATWIMKEIIKIMKSNSTSPEDEAVKRTAWYILPVLNPDGYDYTHDFDRMWKKTRSRHKPLPKGLIDQAINWIQKKPERRTRTCYGVDPNRNWEHNWGQRGSSKNPCNEFYAGPNMFSELETRAVSKFLMDSRKQIKVFISLHSYGQIISYPRKESSRYSSQKYDDLIDMATTGLEALRNSGSNTRYKIDEDGNLLAGRPGSSDYFAMYEAGIPYSFTMFLGDKGAHGFLLPASYIESTSSDAFEIIKTMADYL